MSLTINETNILLASLEPRHRQLYYDYPELRSQLSVLAQPVAQPVLEAAQPVLEDWRQEKERRDRKFEMRAMLIGKMVTQEEPEKHGVHSVVNSQEKEQKREKEKKWKKTVNIIAAALAVTQPAAQEHAKKTRKEADGSCSLTFTMKL